MIKNTPNLFKYATSELSQDAFICWLLAWANPALKDEDSSLHKTGTKLAKTLLNLNPEKERPESIESIEIIRQSSKVDILCRINGKYAILIEDKTNTKHHSNQLAKYYKKLKLEYSEELIHPIYFKTGDQSCYKKVRENGYSVFERADFIEVLDYGADLGIKSDIFHSYRDHLKGIEERINSFISIPYDKWGWYQWIGFYKELQKHINGGWDYVPQKNGGFLGFWWKWHSKTHEGEPFDYYLQLEHKKFCFKVSPAKKGDKSKARIIRDSYRNELLKKANEKGIEVKRNGRIGATMNVAVLKNCYIKGDENKVLDMAKTVDNLKKMEEIISEL